MSAESFLKEELHKIDSKISQKKTSFVFRDVDFELADLLIFAAPEEVFFFKSKEEDYSFLGLGKSVDVDETFIPEFVRTNPNATLVYQDTFEKTKPPICYLPEWTFVKENGSVTLNVYESLEFQTYSPVNLMFNLSVWESFLGPWISYEEKPDRDEWSEMIHASTRLFQKQELEKIVLSRKKIFTYDSQIELPVLFRELYLGNINSSHFSIYHQINFLEAFISFTPERLFTLKGLELETVSLAGSTPRGKTEEEDKLLEAELESSDKLIREHGIVTKNIQDKLSKLSSKLEISPLVTMKLPYIQHRQAKIFAKLLSDVTVIDLIDSLHPTPAVGGIPQRPARDKILEIEKEPREFYAAPVGVISKNFSELAVGIRSAYAINETLTVYGGAGIVAGSIAESEWMETGIKMQPFIKVINKSTI
ncbi:MAG: isochorismate synthase [Bdellovibrionales bacterium]|nr:isochorismate synthase [Bdellovibrionales bacterium]